MNSGLVEQRDEVQLNMGKSRTEHSARNATVAVVAKMVAILMGFCTRVVFTHTLSKEYVGVNGLFMDILNVLALSELGIGTAITYALYKPIAENDTEKQKSLMQLYKKFYQVVALVVLAVGLLVIPFMDILIKDYARVDNLIFIYLMYLANSVISYLLIYKKTLIDAHQLSHIGVLYLNIFIVVQSIIQIAVLLFTGNFVLFLSVFLIGTLLNNICISRKAEQMYPYLKEKKVQPLEKSDKKEIFKNIRAMLMHKVGSVVVNNTDNLLISSMLGIVSVGMYSNYYLVIGSVRQVLDQVFQGIAASVGNLGVEESRERVKKIFEATFFCGQWMIGFATISLYELLSPFVELSFGTQYVFKNSITLVLCLNFYFTGMRQATLVFRDSLGLFWYDRYKSVAEALINLVISIVLGYRFGIIGIFAGTLVSTLTTSLWIEPYMLYKHRLQTPVFGYFVKYAKYLVVTGVVWFFVDVLCNRVSGGVFLQCVFRLIICGIVCNLFYLAVYGKTKEFRFLLEKGKKLLDKKKKRKEKEGQMLISETEENLFKLLKSKANRNMAAVSECDFGKVISLAEKHGVLALLYDELREKYDLPEEWRNKVEKTAQQNVLQQYRLLFVGKYVTGLLRENNISVVVIKGAAIGNYYPVPELRKSGDVDLLLFHPEEFHKARELLNKAGFYETREQHSLHHVCFVTTEGLELELHTMLAEPFDNEKTNDVLKEVLLEAEAGVKEVPVMGVNLPVLSKEYFAMELLLHMLQHFLRAGFGLKQLYDWVMFWQEEFTQEEQKAYLGLMERLRIKGFSDIVTMSCVRFLGLEETKISWMHCEKNCPVTEFMREILDAEEFGESNQKRMVMMRGTGLADYFREFHHQMRLNFPKTGRCFLLWPLLWGITLLRFLRNNRKVRGISTAAALKEAATRSRLMEKIRLFD